MEKKQKRIVHANEAKPQKKGASQLPSRISCELFSQFVQKCEPWKKKKNQAESRPFAFVRREGSSFVVKFMILGSRCNKPKKQKRAKTIKYPQSIVLLRFPKAEKA